MAEVKLPYFKTEEYRCKVAARRKRMVGGGFDSVHDRREVFDKIRNRDREVVRPVAPNRRG